MIMANSFNILTLKDLKGYILEISFIDNSLWFYCGDYFYIIEIKDNIGNIVFKCNIHYDHLMHILFNDIPTLYEYSEPFMENIPITSTIYSNSIYGCDDENENIKIMFEQSNIITNNNKTIVLIFKRNTIYDMLQSGELIEKMTI
jgi:hypothetical protein